MVGIAAMIAGAIFILIGPAINLAGGAVLIAFIINGIITLFTAMAYAELGSAMPEAVADISGCEKDCLDQMRLLADGWLGLLILLLGAFMRLDLLHSWAACLNLSVLVSLSHFLV